MPDRGSLAISVMGGSVLLGEWAGVAVAELVSVIPVLVAAYGVVLGVVVLVAWWRSLRDRRPGRRLRGVVVPRVGVIGRDTEGDVGGGLRC